MKWHFRAILCVCVVMVLGVVIAACADDDGPFDNDDSRDGMNLQEQFDELMQRPDIEQAVGRYQKLVVRVRDALTQEFGLPEWEKGDNGRPSPGCNAFDKVDAWDAETRFLDRFAVKHSLVGEHWQRAVRLMRDIVADEGFTTVTLDVNRKGNYSYELSDDYGAKLYLGSEKSTVLRINTGCHLFPEVKKRGTPSQ